MNVSNSGETEIMTSADPQDSSPSPYGILPSNFSRQSLSGQQLALIKSLNEKNMSLATIYCGGLSVLTDIANSDRFSLCAHAMRELLEKLQEHLDVSLTAQRENLKTKVIEIEETFLDAKKRTTCLLQENNWTGTIDAHLIKFLQKIQNFFDWFDGHHPRRRKEINETLVKLDGSGRALPEPLASLNVDQWEEIRGFFVNVAHHRKITNEQEISQWLNAMERFLIDRLKPRTFVEFSRIDALLDERNPDAKS